MGDVISRQDTINELKNVFDDILCCNVSVRKGLPEAVRRIEMMPSAEPKTGRWAWDNKGYFYCNRCGKKPDDQTRTTDYCPNCGSYNGE